MDSSDSEFVDGETQEEMDEMSANLDDQRKSMSDLLKLYGLNVSEGLDIMGKTSARIGLPYNAHLQHDSGTDLASILPQSKLVSYFAGQMAAATATPGSPLAPSNNNNAVLLSRTRSSSAAEGRGDSQLTGNMLKRFESAFECGEIDCVGQRLRDHYHCEDRYCVKEMPEPGHRFQRTLLKKEEIIRHCKWHKKRTETLKFGFLRFSCSDDCKLNSYEGCQFNGKQTHYHCIETGCDKVYISTSDVQMHANYHRKTNAIKMQGFLRVRNLETCQEQSCPYANHQTTHFHCLREGCQFTFKNKGEMEKHKVFHLRDEQLLNHGFKKFFKADACQYQNCRYAGKLNHIHCVRPNCNYVFHSSGQLMSHKRKHEKCGDILPQQQPLSTSCEDMSAERPDEQDNNSSCSLLDLSKRGRSREEILGQCNGMPGPCLDITSHELERSPTDLTLPTTSARIGTRPIPAEVHTNTNNVLQITSMDGLFNRKRGRPPKNRFVEVYNSTAGDVSRYQSHESSSNLAQERSPQAIFASFKLEKNNTSPAANKELTADSGIVLAKKRPKLEPSEPKKVRQGNITNTDSGAGIGSGVGLIKSNGIFFPNVYDDTQNDDSNSTTDSDSLPQPPALITSTPTPTLMPSSMRKVENNNSVENMIQNMYGAGVGGGMDWLKYAYQHTNPLMVFATTAAILAASMNTAENPLPPVVDPAMLEYARNMFLLNNFPNPESTLEKSLHAGPFANGNVHETSSENAEPEPEYSARGIGNFSKDESIPTGYLKFRFNEDCHFATCGYRNHQSHFHCLRDNCFYSFCDKTRFVQHTARHERLDKLMGTDFKQYRSNMNCGYENCEYMLQQQRTDDGDQNKNHNSKAKNYTKSSHFHCQKCDYICTDTNKVVAHRRQHNKTDFIRLSGFRKVASSEQCSGQTPMQQLDAQISEPDPVTVANKCHYSGKQTHYHCLVCPSVVLNRSQLAVHRHKGQTK